MASAYYFLNITFEKHLLNFMNRKYEIKSSVASTVFSGLPPKRLFVVDYQKYLIQYFQIEYPYQLSGTWIQIQS